MDETKLTLLVISCIVISTKASSSTSVPQTELQKIINLFTTEKQNLQNYVANHESRLDNKINAMELDLNATKAKLDQVTSVLNKERHDREQLQRTYDQLVLDFYNVSVNYNSLLVRVQNTEARNVVMETKNNQLERKNQELENKIQNISQVFNGINISTMGADHADLQELKRKAGYKSGFSAWYPVNGLTTGSIIFSQLVSNIGGQYQPSTGKFICQYPGMYYFSIAIYKNTYSSLAYCYIRKNGSGMISSTSSTTSSENAGGHSLIVHLNTGDVIDAGYCTSASYMSMYSYFTGFLLKAD